MREQGKRKDQSRSYMKILIWAGWMFLISMILLISSCSKEEDSLPECECLEIRKFNQIFYVDINCYDLEELELPPDFVEQFIEKASEKELNIFQNNADCVR